MVANTLTDKLIDGGKNLLQALDATDIKVDAALWFYVADEGFWKLLLSFPDVEKEGPNLAYKKVQKVLSKLKDVDELTLNDIVIAKPDVPLLKLLKSAIRTGSEISGIRFSNNVINGQLIADAYIYRLA